MFNLAAAPHSKSVNSFFGVKQNTGKLEIEFWDNCSQSFNRKKPKFITRTDMLPSKGWRPRNDEDAAKGSKGSAAIVQCAVLGWRIHHRGWWVLGIPHGAPRFPREAASRVAAATQGHPSRLPPSAIPSVHYSPWGFVSARKYCAAQGSAPSFEFDWSVFHRRFILYRKKPEYKTHPHIRRIPLFGIENQATLWGKIWNITLV